MLLVYVLLGALAAAFFGAGFSAHAFYVGDRRTRALRRELEMLQKLLVEKQSEMTEAQSEISKTRTIVRTMERQLRERRHELDGLQWRAARQDEDIAQLRRDADAIRSALAFAGTAALSPAPILTPQFQISTPQVERGEPLSGGAEGNPEWHNKLDTILDSLDRMGNAVESDR